MKFKNKGCRDRGCESKEIGEIDQTTLSELLFLEPKSKEKASEQSWWLHRMNTAKKIPVVLYVLRNKSQLFWYTPNQLFHFSAFNWSLTCHSEANTGIHCLSFLAQCLHESCSVVQCLCFPHEIYLLVIRQLAWSQGSIHYVVGHVVL